ncbi:MAG: ribonuclease E inhibitor RraB [Pyrinomonadaceae bacterium]|nr:ribonuclease E inhibitor RraB [Pyrinomonadaceae bacterium]
MFDNEESQIQGIKEIFDEASANGFPLTEEQLYSYYFVDKNEEKLEKLGENLEGQGYDFIGVFDLNDEENGEPTGDILLHVDKVETHTIESLAKRNVELSKLALQFEVEDYDGWEVGSLDGEDDDDDDEEFDGETGNNNGNHN